MLARTLFSKLRVLSGKRAWVLFLLLTLVLAFPGCGVSLRKAAIPTPPASTQLEPLPTPAPRTELPMSKTITPLLSLSGEVRAKEQVALSATLTGRITELRVGVGDRVRKKDLLVVLEHEAMDVQVKQAEASLAATEAALKGVQAQLELVLAGVSKEQVAVAEAAIRSAEANMEFLLAGATKEQIAAAEAAVAGAQARVDSLLAGATKEQLAIAEFQVEVAEQGVVVASYRTSTYSSTNPGLLEAYTRLRDEELRLARQQVDLARYQLNLLKVPPRPEDVAQLRAGVEGAKAQLEALKAPPRSQQVAQLKAGVDVAKAQLDLVKASLRPQQIAQMEAAIEAARAQVALTQASLQLAKTQREDSFLYSPLDGDVVYRGLAVGSVASPGAPILTIMSRELEVVIAVDEIALGQVSPGRTVSVNSPAYPDQLFTGKVRTIAPVANPATRTFDVSIDLQDPRGLLRPGMSATVSLLKAEGL